MQQKIAPELYERDFALWAEQQAAALRAGRLGELDRTNLAEEVEDLSRRQRDSLLSRLIVLECHLLKLQHEPRADAGRQWSNTVKEQARQIRRLLKTSPSLRREVPSFSEDAYGDAREQAADEMDVPIAIFPQQLPSELWAAVLGAVGGGDSLKDF